MPGREGHIILPWPEGLAKAESMWDAQLNEWLANKKKDQYANGFWHGTDLATAMDIVESGTIKAKPTKERLEGKIVWGVRAGSTDYMHKLLAWARVKAQRQGFVTHEDVPAIVYFETDEQPEQADTHHKQELF